MSRIVQWMRRVFGQRQPTDRLDLPVDWLTIHILFDERYISTKQRRALRSLSGWRPMMKIEPRKFREDITLEQQIERYTEGVEHGHATAIQIHRQEIGEHGTRRNRRAQNSLSELLSVFPDQQIRVVRAADLGIYTESREAGQHGLGDSEGRTVHIDRNATKEESESQ